MNAATDRVNLIRAGGVAMTYLHEARGADKAITDAIDAHLDDALKKDGYDDDGLSGALVPAR
jgi:hypothetical protein